MLLLELYFYNAVCLEKKNMADLFNKIYDATCEYVDNNKVIVGAIVLGIILICFGQCAFEDDVCSDSIIDITKSYDRECYNGAKLKYINNQWICSCEK